MVPLNLNIYNLREQIRKEIVRRLEEVKIEHGPIEIAWLLYALSFEGEDNPLFKAGLSKIENWVLEKVGEMSKDLAPLSLGCFLSKKKEIKEKAIEKISSIVRKNIEKQPLFKFNPLNDPEQVFCASLIGNKISSDIKDKLIKAIEKNINGNISRKVLFSASIIEFESMVDITTLLNEFKMIENHEDIISSLWFSERYREKLEKEKPNIDLLYLWKLFDGIYPSIEMENLTPKSLAMLYEAISKELRQPNPIMLFEIYPIHPEIKKIAKDKFKNKDYVGAVFEAVKKLNEKIQELSGIKDKSEVELVQATMKKVDNPIIQFNEFILEDSGKNEQAGLALITEGIFKAFRNPKGHKPQDHPLLEMTPYEALDQLIIISYIWKRIEKAKINIK